MAALLALVGRREAQPKPAYHEPMVRLTPETRNKWLILFAITLVTCSIAAFYFGGAGSGIYDIVTQVHYHIPFWHTVSLKKAWDASIRDYQRHLWRNGTIVSLAALAVGVYRFYPERFAYAKVGVMDRFEHKLRFPNVKYTLGADKRQAAIKAGERQPGEAYYIEPHVDSKWVDLYQKIITVPLVIIYSVILIWAIYHGYEWLRGHGLHFLPYLGIPSAKETAGADAVGKITNVVTQDWVIKVVFFLPLLITTRYMRGSYYATQRYLIGCRIAKRVKKLERKHKKDFTELSTTPPLHYIAPAWRTAYRYYADLVITRKIPVPQPMSRKAKRWFRLGFLVLTFLFLFGHVWIWTHT